MDRSTWSNPVAEPTGVSVSLIEAHLEMALRHVEAQSWIVTRLHTMVAGAEGDLAAHMRDARRHGATTAQLVDASGFSPQHVRDLTAGAERLRPPTDTRQRSPF